MTRTRRYQQPTIDEGAEMLNAITESPPTNDEVAEMVNAESRQLRRSTRSTDGTRHHVVDLSVDDDGDAVDEAHAKSSKRALDDDNNHSSGPSTTTKRMRRRRIIIENDDSSEDDHDDCVASSSDALATDVEHLDADKALNQTSGPQESLRRSAVHDAPAGDDATTNNNSSENMRADDDVPADGSNDDAPEAVVENAALASLIQKLQQAEEQNAAQTIQSAEPAASATNAPAVIECLTTIADMQRAYGINSVRGKLRPGKHKRIQGIVLHKKEPRMVNLKNGDSRQLTVFVIGDKNIAEAPPVQLDLMKDIVYQQHTSGTAESTPAIYRHFLYMTVWGPTPTEQNENFYVGDVNFHLHTS